MNCEKIFVENVKYCVRVWFFDNDSDERIEEINLYDSILFL